MPPTSGMGIGNGQAGMLMTNQPVYRMSFLPQMNRKGTRATAREQEEEYTQ